MRFSKLTLALLLLVCGLEACGGTPDGELSLDQQLAKKKYTLGKTVDRVHDYSISGWNSVDDRHVIIHTSPTRSYLVTLRSPCRNLDTAETLAFSTTVGNLTRHDKLLVRSSSMGYTEQCFIDTLQELDKVEQS